MHNINYIGHMQQLGLSTHQHGLERRKAKYPTHFKLHNEQWFITYDLAHFLSHCQDNKALQPKGGSHE